jgi:2-iminobutanoate/2-iminopropanoate deaminase
MKEQIFPENGPPPAGPYSPAIRANGFIFVSGQGPVIIETGKPLRGPIKDQVHRTMQNLRLVLEAGGSTLDKIVKTTIYVRDIGNFAAVNEVYGSYFEGIPPARTTIQAANLPFEIDVEIEAIALE